MLSFHHVLTQEVAYGTLLQADRKTRHGRAAETIESLYRGRTEEVCDQLAQHWLRSDRPIAALPYLLTAADGAVLMGANPEAISHLESALELATTHARNSGTRSASSWRVFTSSSASADARPSGPLDYTEGESPAAEPRALIGLLLRRHQRLARVTSARAASST